MKSSKIYQIETNNCWKVKLGFSFLEFYFGPEKLQEKTWIKHFKSIGYWNLENESIQYQYNFLRKIPKILKIPILNTGLKVLKIPIVLNTHTLVETLPQKYPFDWQYQVSEIVGFETPFVFASEFRFRCSWNFDLLPTCAFAGILCTSVSWWYCVIRLVY